MKKTVLYAAALSFMLTSLCVGSNAADSADVHVTIVNGSPALTQYEVNVTDIDGDGALTINDALTLAHDGAFDGGSAAGYASATGDYGLYIEKLWGVENGGSYGYYLNNISAMSLGDAVADGDYLTAFVYTDTDAFSDTYCFFDANTISAAAGESFTLTLNAASFDENWNPVTVPVADAVITVDGNATEYKTDAEGKVTMSLAASGVISAYSEGMTLVAPICKAEVTESAPAVETEEPAETEAVTETEPAAEPDAETAPETEAAPETEIAPVETVTAPQTADAIPAVLLTAAALGTAAYLTLKRRNNK